MIRKTGMVATVALLLGGGAIVGVPTAMPQGQTATEADHLAAIHQGRCRNPAVDPSYVLGVVGAQRTDDGEVADASDVQGTLATPPLMTGGGAAEIALGDLLSGDPAYVLLVHETDDAQSDPLVCGDIAGVVANGQLALALRPLNRSGYAGVAVLGTADTGGTASTVLLFSDVDAYASGARAGGGNANQGRQSGGNSARGNQGGGGGGRAGGNQSGGNQSGGAVTGGVDGGGRANRTPRARRTRTAGQPSPTAVPTAAGEGTVTATVEASATAIGTTEPTAEAPTATVPADGDVTATAVTEPTAVATEPVDAVPTDVPTEAPIVEEPTVAPEPEVVDEIPPAVEGDEIPPAVEGGEAPVVDPVEETPAA